MIINKQNIAEVDFDKSALIPAIVQDVLTG